MLNFKNLGMGLSIVILLTIISACTSKVNQESYEKIKPGMSLREVKILLGEPTNTTSLSYGDVVGTSANWEDHGGSITVQFLNNKVKIKNYNQGSK